MRTKNPYVIEQDARGLFVRTRKGVYRTEPRGPYSVLAGEVSRGVRFVNNDTALVAGDEVHTSCDEHSAKLTLGGLKELWYAEGGEILPKGPQTLPPGLITPTIIT